ncbi:MAG: DNA-processing protein DprA [Nitrospirota bacterium]
MQNLSDQTVYWIGLSSIPGVGRMTFRKLVSHFGSPESVLSATRNDLKKVAGLSDKVVEGITQSRWQEFAEREVAQASEKNVAIIIMNDPGYPENLRTIADPPLYLYVRGTLQPDDTRAVAIVGTRKPTHYGRTITHRMAYELAANGFTIVSGMARGIDTQAHRGALAAGGKTIAVLGCGIDIAYPSENKALMEEIAAHGAIVSENPLGTKPEAGYFPARNRIISGLARGTVIIEAAEDSGSLITAKNAHEQQRKLFAVPGNVGSTTSRGPNSLIKDGAILAETAGDIVRALGGTIKPNKKQSQIPSLTPEEQAVFTCITHEPKHIDVLLHECRSSAGILSGILVSLELKGLAKQLPGKYFARTD